MSTLITKLTAAFTALSMLAAGSGSASDTLNYLIGKGEAPSGGIVTEDRIGISPVELCNEITIGWNLGNTLDATGSGMGSETSWGNPKATEELILAVKDAGFNAIRIPTTWYNHMDSSHNVSKEWMDRVQQVVDYAYNNDMYVILNSHHENWNYPFKDNKANAEKILKKLWKQIAERFKDYDEKLIFEGMNEPRKVGTNLEWNGGDKEGRELVNGYNKVFVDTVRATGGNNEKRCLMIPTYAASASALDGFTIPDDNYLIVSIHAYTPYNFAMNTGQWATDNFSKDDRNSTSELLWLSSELNKRFVSKGVGVIIGECGATDKGNLTQRINWAEYFPDVFGQYGIPVFLWDNGAFGTGGEKYGLIDRRTLKWKYPTYIEALVKSAENA
ncbi:MAG: glycoside hydrolase family 5 protein [Oscillospiraceae bacterium]|nr:glycoside hydrolase family 5 protein [Oscillospiraceae bacterium]